MCTSVISVSTCLIWRRKHRRSLARLFWGTMDLDLCPAPRTGELHLCQAPRTWNFLLCGAPITGELHLCLPPRTRDLCLAPRTGDLHLSFPGSMSSLLLTGYYPALFRATINKNTEFNLTFLKILQIDNYTKIRTKLLPPSHWNNGRH